MGSVKDPILEGPLADRWRVDPTAAEFGMIPWNVKGTFSVKDLKWLIPDVEIEYKADGVAMTNSWFFENLSKMHPDVKHCYLGMLDRDGNKVDVQTLLGKGETSHTVLMKLAHVPESFSGGDLSRYRGALQSGELKCGVADVESIFRQGIPLGSSTFRRIFDAVGMLDEYRTLATYDQVVEGLDRVRAKVARDGFFEKLEGVLEEAKLGRYIPNPGFVLRDIAYDSSTKFELGGDRDIAPGEARALSGLDDAGYELWINDWMPKISRSQVALARHRDILLYDGKGECVAYRRKPVATDFMFTVDENRKTVLHEEDGIMWAIPTSKEFVRARFTQEGVDVAVARAKRLAEQREGGIDNWREYFTNIARDMGIDIRGLAEDVSRLMSYAVAETANRTLGKAVFDVPQFGTWVGEMLPYASRVTYQEVT